MFTTGNEVHTSWGTKLLFRFPVENSDSAAGKKEKEKKNRKGKDKENGSVSSSETPPPPPPPSEMSPPPHADVSAGLMVWKALGLCKIYLVTVSRNTETAFWVRFR